MTRLPVERIRIGKGVHAKAARNYWCAKPGCQKPATEAHHIIRRSELAGAYDAVEIRADENSPYVVHPNIICLCRDHHEMVTVNKAGLAWNGVLNWVTINALGDEMERFPVNPQPAFAESGDGVTLAPSPVLNCPSCHRRMPKPRVDWSDDSEMLAPKKGPSTFAVKIPEAERDFGADQLKDHVAWMKRYCAAQGLEVGGKHENYYVMDAFMWDIRNKLDAALEQAEAA